jgi:hypothetical protein
MAKGKGFKAFEKSKYDVEKKGVKEGSPADRALDRKQMAAAGFRRGGKAKGRK